MFVAASTLVFLGMANIFSLQGYLILSSTIFLFLYNLINGFKKPNFIFWLLLAFGIFYNIFSFINNIWNARQIVYFIIFPCSIYFLSISDAQTNYKKTRIYLLSFALGMFASALITVLATFLLYGFSLSKSQPLISSLLNYEILSRTGLSLYLMPLSVLSFSYILNYRFNSRSFVKWTLLFLSFITIIFSIVCSNNIGNRAYIVAFMIAVIIISLFKIAIIKNNIIKYILIGFILLIVIALICLLFGFVPSFLTNIPVFSRFLSGGSNSDRIKLYREFFTHFIFKPFGGTFVYISDTYIHNFWLDIYNFTGIIPFALFTFLIVRSFYIYGKQYLNNAINDNKNIFFEGMISIFAIGLFEPMLQANPFTYFFFVVFISCTPSSISFKRREEISI